MFCIVLELKKTRSSKDIIILHEDLKFKSKVVKITESRFKS